MNKHEFVDDFTTRMLSELDRIACDKFGRVRGGWAPEDSGELVRFLELHANKLWERNCTCED